MAAGPIHTGVAQDGPQGTIVFVRISIATVVALSTLFIGVLETALAEDTPPGVSRARPHDLDAAGCAACGIEVSHDADADDGDDDPRDESGLACTASPPTGIESAGRRALHATAATCGPQRCRTTDLIRGPPASR